MEKKYVTKHRSGCPINVLFEILHDAWSLLIVRDMMFRGRRTYNEFLGAGEGIATNILSERLQRLEAFGFIDKRRDDADGRRFIYCLTEKGIDLAPMLVEMILWSARYEVTDAPPAVVTEMSADRDAFVARVRENWRALVATTLPAVKIPNRDNAHPSTKRAGLPRQPSHAPVTPPKSSQPENEFNRKRKATAGSR